MFLFIFVLFLTILNFFFFYIFQKNPCNFICDTFFLANDCNLSIGVDTIINGTRATSTAEQLR